MPHEHLGLTQQSLETVKQKLLDKAYGFEEINKRADSIQSLISEFRQSPSSATDVLNHRRRLYEETKPVEKKRTIREIRNGPELVGKAETDNDYHKKLLEESTVAYIMHKLETSLPNFELREEQIKDIVALLEEFHLHAGTGSGKSSVILPIALLTKAITAKETVAGASVSPELVAKLRKDVEKMNGLLPENMRVAVSECVSTEGMEKPKDDKSAVVFSKLARALLDGNGDDPELDKYYHDKLFSYQGDLPLYTFDGELGKKNKPSIRLFKEDDLVFWKMLNPNERLALTYFDEIHVPRDRNNPYYLEMATPVTRESTQAYLFSRIMYGVIANRMALMQRSGQIAEEKGRFDFSKKRYKDEKPDKVYAYNEQRMYDLAIIDWSDPQEAKRAGVLLDPVIEEVASGLSLDQDKLKDWFVNQWKGLEKQGLADKLRYATNDIFKAKNIQSGVHYSLHGGHITSRDPMMGILLPRREFMPEMAVALQALEGEISFINFAKSASLTTSFEGFIVNHLGGKVVGLSGTLLSPSLTSSSFRKSPLAEFLEKATGKLVYTSEKPKSKYIPTPHIYADSTAMNEKMVEQILSENRQVAIFTFNEEEGRWLLSELEDLIGERKIIFVPDNVSESEAEKLYRSFADTPGAVLISSGRAGVGVDIKNSQNEFPDFATILTGMPFATNQVFQVIGRRRLESAQPNRDFSWFVSLDQLKQHPGFKYLEEKDKTKLEKQFEELADPELGKKLARSQAQYSYLSAEQKNKLESDLARHQILSVFQKVLHQAEIQVRQNDWIKVEFDKFYPTALKVFQEEIEKEKKKRDGIFESSVAPRLSDETKMVIDAYLSARGALEPAFATPFEQYLFKRMAYGMIAEKIRRSIQSGDVIGVNGQLQFNPFNHEGKRINSLLEKRKKAVYELLDRRLEPYEIRLYLAPTLSSVSEELKIQDGAPKEFTDPQALENWFLGHLQRFRMYTPLTSLTEEAVQARFAGTPSDDTPSRLIEQVLNKEVSFLETHWDIGEQDSRVLMKNIFFQLANNPAIIYHQLQNILPYAHMPIVRGAGRSSQPEAIVADYKSLAEQYLRNPENIKDWLEIRGAEFAEMMGETANHLKRKSLDTDLLHQLRTRDGRFTSYFFGNLEQSPESADKTPGWVLEQTDNNTHRLYWQYTLTLDYGQQILVRQPILVPSRSIVIQNGVEIRTPMRLELRQTERLVPIVRLGENALFGLIVKK